MTSAVTSVTELVVLPDVFAQDGPETAISTVPGLSIRVLDHPGRTMDDSLDPSWDSIGDLAQHQLARLRAEPAAGPVTLLGAGFGGWVAMEMAMRARELFDRLVLVAPYGLKFGPPTKNEFADILLLDTDEVLAAGWADVDRARGVRLPGFPEDLNDNALADVFRERAMLAQLAWKPFLHDPLLRRWLGALDLPTLVVVGAEDGLVASGNSRTLAEELSCSTLVEVPGVGHYPYLESPQVFNDVVRSFIDSPEEV